MAPALAYAPPSAVDDDPAVSLDAHAQFTREALSHRLLSVDEERELARRWREMRDEGARRTLIECNVRLVYDIAQRYGAGLVSMARLDLVQEGVMGLMHALDLFDERRGWHLATYATWWIRQYIERAIIGQDRAIRLPDHVHTAQSARGWPDARLARLRTVASLDVPLGGDDHDGAELRTLGDTLADDATDGEMVADVLCEADARVGLWARCCRLLTPRERTVLALRFGIGGDPFLAREWADVPLGRLRGNADKHIRVDVAASEAPHTLADVAKLLHVSRERVRQIEEAALAKLRERLTLDAAAVGASGATAAA